MRQISAHRMLNKCAQNSSHLNQLAYKGPGGQHKIWPPLLWHFVGLCAKYLELQLQNHFAKSPTNRAKMAPEPHPAARRGQIYDLPDNIPIKSVRWASPTEPFNGVVGITSRAIPACYPVPSGVSCRNPLLPKICARPPAQPKRRPAVGRCERAKSEGAAMRAQPEMLCATQISAGTQNRAVLTANAK